jgi:hypothetical protein
MHVVLLLLLPLFSRVAGVYVNVINGVYRFYFIISIEVITLAADAD